MGGTADVYDFPHFYKSSFTDDEKNRLGWLGELILNFWAIAMNPNAHFRIINCYSPFGPQLYNAVIYVVLYIYKNSHY